eukprot:CAMPEP_0178381420 /NCGR_PEP_ID=MMETSP0689_2-20121128/5973_1 /TAXON_ID=160604 /ORGANISM="Amphidinium massartii, Strain CS-259" /LENGTH=1091 /DNA_ID=CAMNT_0020001601 /DNA_START=45 /DNA_END=3317 /DNA_ORIENTATION=-
MSTLLAVVVVLFSLTIQETSSNTLPPAKDCMGPCLQGRETATAEEELRELWFHSTNRGGEVVDHVDEGASSDSMSQRRPASQSEILRERFDRITLQNLARRLADEAPSEGPSEGPFASSGPFSTASTSSSSSLAGTEAESAGTRSTSSSSLPSAVSTTRQTTTSWDEFVTMDSDALHLSAALDSLLPSELPSDASFLPSSGPELSTRSPITTSEETETSSTTTTEFISDLVAVRVATLLNFSDNSAFLDNYQNNSNAYDAVLETALLSMISMLEGTLDLSIASVEITSVEAVTSDELANVSTQLRRLVVLGPVAVRLEYAIQVQKSTDPGFQDSLDGLLGDVEGASADFAEAYNSAVDQAVQAGNFTMAEVVTLLSSTFLEGGVDPWTVNTQPTTATVPPITYTTRRISTSLVEDGSQQTSDDDEEGFQFLVPVVVLTVMISAAFVCGIAMALIVVAVSWRRMKEVQLRQRRVTPVERTHVGTSKPAEPPWQVPTIERLALAERLQTERCQAEPSPPPQPPLVSSFARGGGAAPPPEQASDQMQRCAAAMGIVEGGAGGDDTEGAAAGGESTSSLSPVVPGSVEYEALWQLLRIGNARRLGLSDDSRSAYLQIWKVASPSALTSQYAREVHTLRSDVTALGRSGMAMPAARTQLDTASADLQDAGGPQLHSALNEKLLLLPAAQDSLLYTLDHGVSDDSADFSGIFGKGISMAEDCEKVFEESVAKKHADTTLATMEAIERRLYAEHGIKDPPGYVRYAFIVKTLLGIPVYTKDLVQDMHHSWSSIFTTQANLELALVPQCSPPVQYSSVIVEAGREEDGFKLPRHREFVAFKKQSVLVQYVIALSNPPQVHSHQSPSHIPAHLPIQPQFQPRVDGVSSARTGALRVEGSLARAASGGSRSPEPRSTNSAARSSSGDVFRGGPNQLRHFSARSPSEDSSSARHCQSTSLHGDPVCRTESRRGSASDRSTGPPPDSEVGHAPPEVFTISVAYTISREIILDNVQLRPNEVLGPLMKQVQDALGGKQFFLMSPAITRSLQPGDVAEQVGISDRTQLLVAVEGLFDRRRRGREPGAVARLPGIARPTPLSLPSL